MTRTVLGIRRNLSVEVVSDILGWVAVPVLKYRFHKQVDSLHQEVELAGQVPSNSARTEPRSDQRFQTVGEFGGQTTTG